MSSDEDVEPIREYLFDNRGWKLIAVLSKIASSTNGILYSKELSSLLVDLLPIILKFNYGHKKCDEYFYTYFSSTNNENGNFKYDDCFKMLNNIDFCHESGLLTPSKVKSMVKGIIKHQKGKASNKSIDSSSESDGSVKEKKISKHEISDFQIEVNDSISRKLSTRKIGLCFSDFGDSSTNEQFSLKSLQSICSTENICISMPCLFFLCSNIIWEFLLHEQKSIYLRESHSFVTYPNISMSLTDLLKLLSDEVTCDASNLDISSTKKFTLPLVFLSASILSRYDFGLKVLEKGDFIPRIMLAAKNDSIVSMDIVLCVLKFLTVFAQNLPHTHEYTLFVHFVRMFITSDGKEVTVQCLDSIDKVITVINAMSQLVNSLQRAKILWCHQNRCYHRKHTRCDLSSLLFHHDDILGQRVSHSTTFKSPLCSISSITSLMLTVLDKVDSPSAVLAVVERLSGSSFCCCLNSNKVIENFLIILDKYNCLDIHKRVLNLIENIVKNQKLELDCCKQKALKDIHLNDSSLTDTTDSACCSDGSCCCSVDDGKSCCEIGKHYRTLLQNENPSLRNVVVKHIWALIHLKCESYSYCICQHVAFQLLILRNSTPENIEFSLTLLRIVLSNPQISKHFLSIGGMSQLLHLLRTENYAPLVLNALEVLVFSEIQLIEESEDSVTSDVKFPALSSYLNVLRYETNDLIAIMKQCFRQLENFQKEKMLMEEFNVSAVLTKVFFVMNLWRVHSKLSCHSDPYTNYIKMHFPEIVTVTYSFFEISLRVFSFYELTGIESNEMLLSGDDQDNCFKTFVDILEMILPVCLRFCPFICDTTNECEVNETKIFKTLKHNIFGLNSNSEKNMNHLSIVVKMILNCSLWYSRMNSKHIRQRELYAKGNEKISGHGGESSRSETEESECDSVYEADDESCDESNVHNENNKHDKNGNNGAVIYYGELCKLLFEVLIEFNSDDDSSHTLIIITVCKRLLTLCRETEENCTILYKYQIPNLILIGFRKILTTSQNEFISVQNALLDLFLEVCYHKIDGSILKAFLSLLKLESSPLQILIPALLQLITVHHNLFSHKPTHCLKFPADPLLSICDFTDSWINQYRTQFAITKDDSATSSWYTAAICIPLPKQASSFLSRNKCFSIAFWASFETQVEKVKYGKREAKMLEANFHMVSLTLDSACIEIWFNAELKQIVFKIVKIINGKIFTISECAKQFKMSNRWHFFCFNFREVILKKNIIALQVSFIIDGIQEESFALNHNGSIPKNANSSALLIGHTKSISTITHFGNFYFFKNVLSIESFLYLYCNGPDFSDFTVCQIDETQKSELNLRTTNAFLNSSFLEAFVTANPYNGISNLRRDILVAYKIGDCDYSLFYTNSSVSASFSSFFRHSSNENSLQQVYRSHIHKFSNLKAEKVCHFPTALTEIGGIGVMLFLFAKVVEDSDIGMLHSDSLLILLRTCELNIELMNIFVRDFDGFQMVNAVLQSQKCLISNELLNAYLSCCVNNYSKYSTIISPAAFSAFVQSWKAWQRSNSTAKMFYGVLQNLVDENNPNCFFNLKQMKKSNIFQLILSMVEDSYSWLQESAVCFPECALEVIPKVLYRLSTSPIDISLINDLMNCVLLLHKASNAYVCHTKNSFYYCMASKWLNPREHSSLQTSDDWDIIRSDYENTDVSAVDNLGTFLSNIISVISNVVEEIPDSQLNGVFSDIIKLDFITVLLHNDKSCVREECLKLIARCAKFSESSDAIRQFFQKKGHHLLSNQLHQHPATETLINTVFEMIMNLDSNSIDLNSEELIFREVDKEKWNLFVLLFALIPNSVLDKFLCHNTLKTLCKIIKCIDLSSPFLKFVFDNGIIECLLKTIINVEEQSNDDDGSGYDDNLIHSDIYDLVYTLSRITFNSNGTSFFQCYFNVIDVISHFEKTLSPSVALIFRECLIKVFEAGFDVLEMYVNWNGLSGSQRWNSRLSLGSLKSEYFLNLLHVTESNCNFETPVFSMPETVSTSSVSIHGTTDEEKEKFLRLSESELSGRFSSLLTKATEFTMRQCERNDENKREIYFERTYVHFLVTNFEYYLRYQKNRSRSFWFSVLSSSKEVLKNNVGQCIVFLLSRVDSQEEAAFVSSFIRRNFEVMRTVPKLHQKVLLPLECFLKDMIAFNFPIEEMQSIENLLKIIEDIRIKKRIQFKCYKEVISEWFSELDRDRQSRKKLSLESGVRAVSRIDELTAIVTEQAMSVTRDFVEAQNRERKQFFNYIKQVNSLNFSIKKAWNNLITTFFHEKSVWFFKEAFPNHWELDPTEGPLRVRRRLRRCFLNIDQKFFRSGSEVEKPKSLLSYLFAKNKYETDSSAFIDRIHTNERITYTSPCLVVTPAEEFPGEILIGSSCVHFVGEQRKSKSDSSVIAEVWMFEEIKEVNKCRFQLQNNAIEMFLTNGVTYLIAFETNASCNEFLHSLLSRNLPNLVVDKSLLEITQSWRERKITNFEYLTYLNKLAGRSFNDLMQYPVFPFVLSDYECETLDLETQNSFRKLNRPMAVQKKSKEDYYVNQYTYLKAEYESTQHLGELMLPTTGPYHYGSHYSNSGTVLHFLVRLPPFTEMFLQYQDNNFDIPDRTFHSLSTSWKLSSGDSTTDFKELIPEFFFLPEFLINSENFNFGVRQNNEVVDNVNLPNWCRNDPRLFILIHRQALESDFVTEHLNEWIDLVFGYQQLGKFAVDAINVFHPATYYGVDASKIKDPLKRKALQTMTKTFGQMPKQLFVYPHPKIYPRVQRIDDIESQQVIGEVNGLKWGSFVFSPSESPPFICKKSGYSKVASLVPILTNEVFGFPKNSCLLVNYSKHKGGALANATYITGSSVISWNHGDAIVRIKYNRDSPSVPLLSTSSVLDRVSVCCSATDLNILLIGYDSGSVAVYAFKRPLKIGTPADDLCVKRLVGHSRAVSALFVSKEFSVAVSGGKDGQCLLWDLNKYCYVRTITEHDNKIKLLVISPTLGDIVSVSDFGNGSTLKVNTINGTNVGHIKTEVIIEAVCYSSAAEGLSVNVIATGFANGTIKLWSSWDLTAVRIISVDRFTAPIKCITFSTDNHSFYAVNTEGTLIVWTKDREKMSNLFPHLLTF